MSGHGQHDDGADLHAGHDEPSSDEYPAGEPRSPGWLPLLGGALLLAGIFALVVYSSEDQSAASAAQPAAAAPGVPPAMAQPAQRPAAALPPGTPAHP